MREFTLSAMQLGTGFVISCVVFAWIFVGLDVLKTYFSNPHHENEVFAPRKGDWHYPEYFDKIEEFRSDFDS